MKKPDPTEHALNRLSALRTETDSSTLVTDLCKALKDRSNLVVAKAATIAGELRCTEVIPDLLAAFERLMKNPTKLDKRCAGTFAIATALHEMDYTDPDVYLAGIHHVQMEGSFGPPVDEAAKLRAQCALGLARTRHPDALIAVSELLADKEPHARIGAIRALAANAGEAGVLLLRYKAVLGDKDPEVLAECLSGLLSADFMRSLPFVARFMDSSEDEISESAILAVASQRRTEAFTVLREKWERSVHGELRSTLLTAFVTMRLDEATDFLLNLLEGAATSTAIEIVKVLAAYHRQDRVRERIDKMLGAGGNPELRKAFREMWG